MQIYSSYKNGILQKISMLYKQTFRKFKAFGMLKYKLLKCWID